jgi:hypothetical protein
VPRIAMGHVPILRCKSGPQGQVLQRPLPFCKCSRRKAPTEASLSASIPSKRRVLVRRPLSGVARRDGENRREAEHAPNEKFVAHLPAEGSRQDAKAAKLRAKKIRWMGPKFSRDSFACANFFPWRVT